MKNYLRIITASTCLLFGLTVTASAHQAAATSSDTSSKHKHKHKSKSTDTSAPAAATPPATAAPAAAAAPAAKVTRKPPTPTNNASDSDIAAAKTSGKVWVNTESKVYHKGGQFYGKTKHGQFMTEDEAQKAGYHQAKSEIGSKKS
jgi:hypothetical protein